jgi:hypothetical protein
VVTSALEFNFSGNEFPNFESYAETIAKFNIGRKTQESFITRHQLYGKKFATENSSFHKKKCCFQGLLPRWK